MSEPKFTPGPWVVCPDVGHQIPVASVAMDGIKLNVSHVAGIRNGEGAANARLIAAAPELYEALEMLLRLDEEHQRGADDDDVCFEVRTAKTALAKARGEG